jgi:predicted transcriptional regulator
MKRTEDLKTRLSIVKTWEQKMKDLKLNPSKLAKLSGVHRQSIYTALKGETLPSFKTINKIEEILNDYSN